MNYSVIIPSLYEVDGAYLKLCVESLRESGFDGQIIVVTNGSKYNPPLSEIKGISVHLHTNQQGQCNAVNIGAQLVTADYIMVSNSDMYYATGWNKYLRFNYPVFSPNLVEPINNAGSAPPFLKFDGGLTLEEFNNLIGVGEFGNESRSHALWEFIHTQINDAVHQSPTKHWDGHESRPDTEESGFNLPFFIKRDFWNFLGGYDVAFDPFGSNSDTDLQTRINLAGVTPMRLRDVLVYHFSNKTPTFSPENDKFRLFNFDYFKQKFGFDRDDVDGKGLKSDVWYNRDMVPENKERIQYHQKPYLG